MPPPAAPASPLARLPAWLPRVATAAALLLLVAWSTIARWQYLATSPYPLGIDGYFYPVQLRELLATGHLHYASSPLVLWLMAPLAAVTDPIVGAKLGAAIGGALVAWPLYGIGRRLGGSRGAGLLAAAIATTSAGSHYLGVEFVKNGVGLTLAMASVWALLRASDRPGLGRLATAGALLLATALAHKMAFAVAVVLVAPAVGVALHQQGVWRRVGWRWIVGSAVALAAVGVAVAWRLPERFIAPRDLALVPGLVSSTARWDAPALALPNIVLPMDHEALLGGLVALLALGLVGVAFVRWLPGPAPRPAFFTPPRVLLLTLIVAGLILGLPWLNVGDPQGLGFRLRLAAFIPLALLVASLLAHVPARADARHSSLVAAGLAVVAAVAPPHDRDQGVVRAHPAMVSAIMQLAPLVPEGTTVVVTERHIGFMVNWYAQRNTTLSPSSVDPAHRVRLMPLACVGARSALDTALLAARHTAGVVPPIGLHPRHPNGLVLVPDATWLWVLDQLPRTARKHFAAWPTI